MGRKGFSYDLINSDETRAIYEQMLGDDASKVLAAAGLARVGLDKAFRAWWLVKGSTKFATVEDSLRYKRELAARLAALTGVA